MIATTMLTWVVVALIAGCAMLGAWDCVAVWGGCWALGVGVGWLSTRPAR